MTEEKIVQPVDFVKLAENKYWHDMNGDGRVEDRETVIINSGESFETKAKEHIKANPSYYLDCSNIEYIPKHTHASLQKYFEHPRKVALIAEVESDIAKLQAMKDKPAVFTRLLDDLEKVRVELDHTIFRYPAEDEVPDGFIGVYNALSSTMIVAQTAPTALLIHEMDHALTAHQRVKKWSMSITYKDGFGHSHVIPKDPTLPFSNATQTSFDFELDFPTVNRKKFFYNEVDAYDPMLKSLANGEIACLTAESKRSALANEVRGT